jgi:hypothetical protein
MWAMLCPEGLFVYGDALLVGLRHVGSFMVAEHEPVSGQRACQLGSGRSPSLFDCHCCLFKGA